MNISLTDELKSIVDYNVDTGFYANASDYIRALIRKDWHETDKFTWTPEALKAAIAEGEASGKSSRTIKQIIAEEQAKFTA